MNKCQKVRKNIVAFLYGELSPNDQLRVKAHLDVCSLCRDEARELEFIQKESGFRVPGMSEAMSSMDWEILPEKIADKVLKQDLGPNTLRMKKTWFSLFQPKWRPVYIGLLSGIIIGSLSTLLVSNLEMSFCI